MKRIMYKLRATLIITLTNLLISSSIFAQAPEKMSYQAVVRDGSNNLVTSSSVGMQLSILQGSASGTPVYVETQTPTSNANGLVSLEIGDGTIVSGDFATIDWADGPYFIQTETDPTGGTNYTITGTSQLLSVPYALYAKTAESLSAPISDLDDFNYWGKYSNGLYTTENKVLIGDVDTNINYSPRLFLLTESPSTSRGADIIVNSAAYTGSNPVIGSLNSVFGSNNSPHRGAVGRAAGSGTGRQSGVRGETASSGTGFSVGVEGINFSTGTGDQAGVYGQANVNTTSFNYGVYGLNYNEGNSLYNTGVYGEASENENDNYGIDGTASGDVGTNYGVSGWAFGTGNINYAVYGQAGTTGSTNYAGYFNGDVNITGTLTNPSDRKLKTNITAFTAATNKIMNLGVYNYTYKDGNLNLPRGMQYGFIAQEVEATFPDLVKQEVGPIYEMEEVEGPNGKISYKKTKAGEEHYKAVNYIGLIPVVTKALQEQVVKIEALEKENKELRERLKQLEEIVLEK